MAEAEAWKSNSNKSSVSEYEIKIEQGTFEVKKDRGELVKMLQKGPEISETSP